VATPKSLIVIAPELAAKLSELNDAAPLADVEASARFIVTSPEDPPPDKLVPAVTAVISPTVGVAKVTAPDPSVVKT